MAEKKSEFERRREAFLTSHNAEEHYGLVVLGEALKKDYPDKFQADENLTKCLVNTYIHHGLNRLNDGEFEEAIINFNKAIESEPNNIIALNNRGVAYKEKDEHDTAIIDYTQAIELKPDYVDAYINHGNSFVNKHDFERAIADFDKAIKLEPVNAGAFNNRGKAYAEKGKFDKAIADFDRAIEFKPDLSTAYHNRAMVIGLKVAKETEERLKQSYEEQLASISNPIEINKFFEEEIANSKIRLDELREEGKTVGETLWRKLGLVWVFSFGAFAGLKVYNLLPIDTIFLQLLSFSFSVIFLSSPFIWHLRRVNHDIRVERHALEDFRRKWIMLLLRVAQGDEAMRNQQTADIIQHFDKRGTPEVLNRLYHPKYAYSHKNNSKDEGDDEALLERLVTLITKKKGKDE